MASQNSYRSNIGDCQPQKILTNVIMILYKKLKKNTVSPKCDTDTLRKRCWKDDTDKLA